MGILKKLSIQLFTALIVGVMMGVWQYIPSVSGNQNSQNDGLFSLSGKIKGKEINQNALKDTAHIESLLNLKAPGKNASVEDWYKFALSFNDLDLGKRYGNRAQTTPMLGWYALIAKHKPQALYKLYNQGKLDDLKFEHLLRFGYLKYWDEYVNKVDETLLKTEQAVLTMAYTKGEEQTRKRVAKAFFKLGNPDITPRYKNELNVEILLFAMKGMSELEKQGILPILQRGVFKIDPRFLYRLELADIFTSPRKEVAALIDQYAKGNGYAERSMSSYMTDGARLGNVDYIKAMLNDVETNADQPTNFYCAACGLALSTDGLMGYPLINSAKRGKIQVEKGDKENYVITRKRSLF